MDGKDIVLANPLHFACSIGDFWMSKLIPEDVTVFYLVLQALDPNDFEYAKEYFRGNLFYACNMFVCRKSLFNEFAEWQFNILKKVEEIIPKSGYSRERRILGFFAEAMLPIFFLGRGHKIKTYPIVDMVGKKALLRKRSEIKRKYLNRRTDIHFNKHRTCSFYMGEDYYGGLQQDGIMREIGQLYIDQQQVPHLDDKTHHVLCLDNSITLHPRKDDIGWHSEHGMAASMPQKDYVHLLENRFKQHNASSSVMGINIAEWEINSKVALHSLFGKQCEGKDIIVLRLGENVRDIIGFQSALNKLVQYCMTFTENIILTGCVWKNEAKEHTIITVAKKHQIKYVPLHWILLCYPDAYAHVGETISDTEGHTYTLSNPFITSHPGDIGMQMIADAIYYSL